MIDPSAWPELREAREDAARARAAWHAAQLAYWRAPAGKRAARNEALQRATREALQADVQVKAAAARAGVR